MPHRNVIKAKFVLIFLLYDLQLACGLNILLSKVENKCSAVTFCTRADKNLLSLFLIKIIFVIIIEIKKQLAIFSIPCSTSVIVTEEKWTKKNTSTIETRDLLHAYPVVLNVTQLGV